MSTQTSWGSGYSACGSFPVNLDLSRSSIGTIVPAPTDQRDHACSSVGGCVSTWELSQRGLAMESHVRKSVGYRQWESHLVWALLALETWWGTATGGASGPSRCRRVGRAPEESTLTQGFIPSQGGSPGVFGKIICISPSEPCPARNARAGVEGEGRISPCLWPWPSHHRG